MESISTPQSFEADIAGRKFRGTWRIDWKSVRVECDYGTGLALLRPGANEVAVARRVLQKIVSESPMLASRNGLSTIDDSMADVATKLADRVAA